MTFGETIKSERIRRGLTIQALANKMGVGNSYVRQYETEARQPKIETIVRFGEGLGMSKRELKKLVNSQIEEALGGGKNDRLQ